MTQLTVSLKQLWVNNENVSGTFCTRFNNNFI